MKASEIYGDMCDKYPGNDIHPSAIIYDNVSIGTGNTIGAFCVIGFDDDIANTTPGKFKGRVDIGNNNAIGCFVTIGRPYNQGATVIGDNNLISNSCLIGHDAQIGSFCILRPKTKIAGFCRLFDHVNTGLNSTVIKRSRLGLGSYLGACALANKDVPPFVLSVGVPAKPQRFNQAKAVELGIAPEKVKRAQDIFEFLIKGVKVLPGDPISDAIHEFLSGAN